MPFWKVEGHVSTCLYHIETCGYRVIRTPVHHHPAPCRQPLLASRYTHLYLHTKKVSPTSHYNHCSVLFPVRQWSALEVCE